MKHIELATVTSNKLGDIKNAGNHWAVIRGSVNHCYYYSTEICTVNHASKIFQLIDRKISMSTSCACGKYRNYLTARGYKQVPWNSIGLN
jgi:hypothetical protein